MKKKIIVISGATATGKSDFALKMAMDLGGEIINADIGSWYSPLTIGTAKPDWKKESVPHHLFDILDTPGQFTVTQFRDRVKVLTEEIWSRGNLPIVVGGSAFYIKSLWYAQHDIPDAQEVSLQLDSSEKLTVDLWKELETIDPIRASRIDQHDRYRVVRALAIYLVTGKAPSTFEPIFDPIAPDMELIVCSRQRDELYRRIDHRVLLMIQAGWIEEVVGLVGTPWETFLGHKKIIGYDDMLHYLGGSKSFADYTFMVATIQQKTRNYAKRQVTFLSKLQKDIRAALACSGLEGQVTEIDLGNSSAL